MTTYANQPRTDDNPNISFYATNGVPMVSAEFETIGTVIETQASVMDAVDFAMAFGISVEQAEWHMAAPAPRPNGGCVGDIAAAIESEYSDYLAGL